MGGFFTFVVGVLAIVFVFLGIQSFFKEALQVFKDLRDEKRRINELLIEEINLQQVERENQ